jgi:hypothetical protein
LSISRKQCLKLTWQAIPLDSHWKGWVSGLTSVRPLFDTAVFAVWMRMAQMSIGAEAADLRGVSLVGRSFSSDGAGSSGILVGARRSEL